MDGFDPLIKSGDQENNPEGLPPILPNNVINEANLGSSAAKLEKPKLPGDPLLDRPIQNQNGQWFNNFGETEISPEQAKLDEESLKSAREKLKVMSSGSPDSSEQTSDDYGLDVGRLKSIHDRCTATYEGKYPTGLLGVNVVLDEADITEVKNLVSKASEIHTASISQIPDWDKFNDILEQRRAKLGVLREKASIIEDDTIDSPRKALSPEGVPLILVPPNIFRAYRWNETIKDTKSGIEDYLSGTRYGTPAKYLGVDIKDVYRFVKESKS